MDEKCDRTEHPYCSQPPRHVEVPGMFVCQSCGEGWPCALGYADLRARLAAVEAERDDLRSRYEYEHDTVVPAKDSRIRALLNALHRIAETTSPAARYLMALEAAREPTGIHPSP